VFLSYMLSLKLYIASSVLDITVFTAYRMDMKSIRSDKVIKVPYR
jgi:hypothetical protein